VRAGLTCAKGKNTAMGRSTWLSTAIHNVNIVKLKKKLGKFSSHLSNFEKVSGAKLNMSYGFRIYEKMRGI
jgi:hypothetical protein